MGLSTARLLQLQGARVTLYTRDLPPETTSNIAGAQWWPVTVVSRNHKTEAFGKQFVEAANFSYHYFQNLVSPAWGVRWLPNYYLSENAPGSDWMSGPGGVLHHLQIGFRDSGPGEHIFPAKHVRRFHTMLIEPATYLNRLMSDVQGAGAAIEIRDCSSEEDILAFPPRLMFLCSGLGAKDLFGDEKLVPIRGQLSVMIPQAKVNYNLISNHYYMFPRTDGIILGGTYNRGSTNLSPDPVHRKRIIETHQATFRKMAENISSFRRGSLDKKS
jgi:glycine/D-amino acid oxidase-like deaminating enzyme